MGQWGLSIARFKVLKSLTILTSLPFPLMTGKALLAHWLGSSPHFSRIPASKQAFISLVYAFHKWKGVSYGREQCDGRTPEFSFSFSLTGGCLILSPFSNTSLKHSGCFLNISSLFFLHLSLGSLISLSIAYKFLFKFKESE